MKKFSFRSVKMFLILALLFSFTTPVHGFLWWGNQKDEKIENLHKQVIVNSTLTFSPNDFYGKEGLVSINILSLPDSSLGSLTLGEQIIQSNEIIGNSALTGLNFVAKNQLGTATFEISPNFSDGTLGDPIEITIAILDIPNEAPLAKDMALFTYKNIAITCYFDVIDSENDLLNFQIVDPPARGSVTLSENGSSSFLYTPYENKTGKDTFSYIATDSLGNISNEGTISIRIEKANTPVTYGDMQDHPSHKAAISLAESGIFVGECIGSTYLFHPDEAVSREEFLSLAMAVADLAPLEEISFTGFYDDNAIPTWSKGYISSALLAGVIQGTWDDSGRPVFSANSTITLGEASVILDNLLNINQVSQVSSEHWASQASANLSAVGVSTSTNTSLPTELSRSEVAELLDSALEITKENEGSWFNW